MKPSEPSVNQGPVSLSRMQVDVTTRLGALTPATPTGLATLDRMLTGGLRRGTMLALSGEAGIGKTAFALLLSYMAARAKAAVLYTSVALDETEVMARFAARALHREHPEALTPYGEIWSGQAWQKDATRRPVSEAVDTVVKKVGSMLHLHRASAFESTKQILARTSELWTRHERVVLVVDGIEAFSAAGGDDPRRQALANSGFESRVSQVALELRQLSEHGCAVVVTLQGRNTPLVSPAATLSAYMRNVDNTAAPINTRVLSLGARPVELVVEKNSLGPTGIVPLLFVAGAGIFEERAP